MSQILDGDDTVRQAREERGNGLIKFVVIIIHPSLFFLDPNFGFVFKDTKLVVE